MLDFKDPQIEDRQWVTALIESAGRESCEYCFGNVFVWSPVYKTRIVRFEDYFISLSGAEDGMYCFPMGHGDLRKAVDELHRDAVQRGNLLRFFGVTQEDKTLLETLYPDRFLFRENRDFFDYIYAQSDLAALSGKKYHAKRNHINKFEATYESRFEIISAENKSDLEKAIIALREDPALEEENKTMLVDENAAIDKLYENFDILGLTAGVLYADGNIAAYTIGEMINGDTALIHVEKAHRDIEGAYTVINQKFIKEAQ